MTIEFHCNYCDKRLTTTDDKAGRQAMCPGCGQLIEIPVAGGSFADEASSSPSGSFSDFVVPPPIPGSSNAESAETNQTCPACGTRVPTTAIRCDQCGVLFAPVQTGSRRLRGRREIRPFPPGEVIADAWRIYTERIGLLTGSFIAIWVLTVVTGIIGWAPIAVAELLFDQDEWIGAAIAGILGAILLVAATAFAFHLQAGYLRLQLKVAREEPADFSEVFTGGRFILRMAINSIVYGLIVSVGTMLCLVPGILLAFIFWPFAHVLVDTDPPGLNSLSHAKRMTDGNWGPLFIVFIVAGASILAGYCACGIGLIISMPYVNLLYAVAYDRMSCQTALDDGGRN